MFIILKAETFIQWFNGLKDQNAKNKIRLCLDRVGLGNLGDHHSVGDGVSEFRIDYGPGYRIYYTMRGQEIIILLAGGTKSGQARDIERAKKVCEEVRKCRK